MASGKSDTTVVETAAITEESYRAQVRADLPRNYAVSLVHGLLGMTGFRLISAPTFVPAYIFLLSGSEIAVGAALASQHLGSAMTAVWGATLIEHRKRVLPVGNTVGMLLRMQLLGLALTGYFLSGEWTLIAACVFLGLFGLFNGMQSVIFHFLLSKVIPVYQRGRLTGLRNFLGGLIAAAVAFLGGKYLVQTNAFGNGYASTFMVAFILTSLGLVALSFMREPEPPQVREPVRFWSRINDLPDLLRSDTAFTCFFVARALAALGMAAVPFYALYASKWIGLSGVTLGYLSLAFLLAQTMSNLGWGWIADRHGNRLVFLASVGIWAVSAAALMMSASLPVFLLVFCGLGAGLGGFQIAAQNMVFEFGNRHDLPMRIAVSDTASYLMMAAGPLLGGFVAHHYSYTSMFLLVIGVKLVSLTLVGLLVAEPRQQVAEEIG
jgi:MFS family permease